MEKEKIIIFSLCFLLAITSVYAISNDAKLASNALELAKKNMTDMENSEFNVFRVEDIYSQAKEDFDSKVILEERGKSVDYSNVISRTDEITTIHDQSFIVYDELLALELTLEGLDKDILNETFSLYNDVKSEFLDERYDECLKLIDKTYDKLSEEQSAKTTISVLNTASKTLKNFIIDNWNYILSTFIIIIIILVFTYRAIRIYFIKSKMKRNEIEKETIRKLMVKAQKDYFERGIISESDYHIKEKKFGELVRDIDRQMPLLREEIAKIQKIGKKLVKKQIGVAKKTGMFVSIDHQKKSVSHVDKVRNKFDIKSYFVKTKTQKQLIEKQKRKEKKEEEKTKKIMERQERLEKKIKTVLSVQRLRNKSIEKGKKIPIKRKSLFYDIRNNLAAAKRKNEALKRNRIVKKNKEISDKKRKITNSKKNIELKKNKLLVEKQKRINVRKRAKMNRKRNIELSKKKVLEAKQKKINAKKRVMSAKILAKELKRKKKLDERKIKIRSAKLKRKRQMNKFKAMFKTKKTSKTKNN